MITGLIHRNPCWSQRTKSSGKHRSACGWLCLVASCEIGQPVGLRVLTGSKLGLNPLISALASVRSTEVQGSYTTALKQDKIWGLGAEKASYVNGLSAYENSTPVWETCKYVQRDSRETVIKCIMNSWLNQLFEGGRGYCGKLRITNSLFGGIGSRCRKVRRVILAPTVMTSTTSYKCKDRTIQLM